MWLLVLRDRKMFAEGVIRSYVRVACLRKTITREPSHLYAPTARSHVKEMARCMIRMALEVVGAIEIEDPPALWRGCGIPRPSSSGEPSALGAERARSGATARWSSAGGGRRRLSLTSVPPSVFLHTAHAILGRPRGPSRHPCHRTTQSRACALFTLGTIGSLYPVCAQPLARRLRDATSHHAALIT